LAFNPVLRADRSAGRQLSAHTLGGGALFSMAFTELESRRHHKLMQLYVETNRPPPEIRPQLDLSYRILGQSIEIFEVRPSFKNPKETMEEPVAKATYVRRAHEWRIYWQRADLKWHRYEPYPTASSLGEFLNVVTKDEHCCFYG
jgi:hypothetical protein